MDNWEKFVSGEPLNEELAALRAGELPPEAQPAAELQDEEPSDWEMEKPLTRSDLAELRELRNSRGWTLFILLQKRALRIHERSAITKSKQAPLSNKDEVAHEWACVAIYERAIGEMRGLLDSTIQELERDEKR